MSKRRQIAAAELEEAARDIADGATLKDIAAQIGVGAGTLAANLERAGLRQILRRRTIVAPTDELIEAARLRLSKGENRDDIARALSISRSVVNGIARKIFGDRRRRLCLSSSEVDAIRADIAAGGTIIAHATRIGCHPKTLSVALRGASPQRTIATRKNRSSVSADDVLKMREMRRNRISIAKIAAQFGVSPPTVGKHVRGILDSKELVRARLRDKHLDPAFAAENAARSGATMRVLHARGAMRAAAASMPDIQDMPVIFRRLIRRTMSEMSTDEFAEWRAAAFPSCLAAERVLGLGRETIRAYELGRTKNGAPFPVPPWLILVCEAWARRVWMERRRQMGGR